MNVKDVEENVLERLFNCKKSKDTETKKIIKHLKSLKGSKEETEAPDFLFIDGSKIIGVEHFLVDTLRFPTNKRESVTRDVGKNIPELLEKYKYGESFKENPESMTEALSDVSKDALKIVNSSYNFDNSLFIEEFHRIALGHKGKVSNYKGRIKKIKGVKDSDISIYFLIEIPYKKQSWNMIDKNGKKHRQLVNGIPFTEDFVDKLKKLSNVDYVILFFVDALNNKNDDFVFAFSTKDIEKTLRDNKISIYKDFKSERDGIIVEMEKIEEDKINKTLTVHSIGKLK